MKTKIRTLITICALGFVGILNASATVNNKSADNSVVLNETVSSIFNENIDEMIDFRKEAQLMTKMVADKEEAKAVQKLMDEGLAKSNESSVSLENEATAWNIGSILDENVETKIDFQKEASLVTKMVADKEEAKAVRKLIDEGKLAENK